MGKKLKVSQVLLLIIIHIINIIVLLLSHDKGVNFPLFLVQLQ